MNSLSGFQLASPGKRFGQGLTGLPVEVSDQTDEASVKGESKILQPARCRRPTQIKIGTAAS